MQGGPGNLRRNVAEIDEATWNGLSVGLADPPQDWAGPLETVDVVQFGTGKEAPVSDDISAPTESTD